MLVERIVHFKLLHIFAHQNFKREEVKALC